jgi:hypothetical protein
VAQVSGDLNVPLILGAPGLASETWESTDPYPPQSVPGFLVPTSLIVNPTNPEPARNPLIPRGILPAPLAEYFPRMPHTQEVNLGPAERTLIPATRVHAGWQAAAKTPIFGCEAVTLCSTVQNPNFWL